MDVHLVIFFFYEHCYSFLSLFCRRWGPTGELLFLLLVVVLYRVQCTLLSV